VKQAVGGYIEEVAIKKCSGGDDQFRKSVEEAVWKSDPLPAPPDDELFQRELIITFRPS
jgi:colicin import membrane protein